MVRGKQNNTSSTSSAARKPRPLVELVEVSSEKDEMVETKGGARGLSTKNTMLASLAHLSVDQSTNEGDENGYSRRMTRGSRNGRTDKPINYDAKYHPMDEVTRPKAAAKRRAGSHSASAQGLRAQDDETSDVSLPSSAQGSEDEESDGEAESDIDELPARTPDPRAVRHSARAEANKPVNYSRKHHPQDFGLPGHQYKAKKLERVEKKCKRASERASTRSQTTTDLGMVDDDNADQVLAGDEVAADEAVDKDIDRDTQPKQTSRPRKKLRMLTDDRSPPSHRAPEKSRPRKVPERGDALPHSDKTTQDMSDDAVMALMDDFAGDTGTDRNGHSTRSQATQNLTGMIENDQASSYRVRTFVAAKKASLIGGLNTFESDDEQDEVQGKEPEDEHRSGLKYQDVGNSEEWEDVKSGQDQGDDDGDDEDEDDMFQIQPAAPSRDQAVMPPPWTHSEKQSLVEIGDECVRDEPPVSALKKRADALDPLSSSTLKASSRVNSRVISMSSCIESSSTLRASSPTDSRQGPPRLVEVDNQREDAAIAPMMQSDRDNQPLDNDLPESGLRSSDDAEDANSPSAELQFYKTPHRNAAAIEPLIVISPSQQQGRTRSCKR